MGSMLPADLEYSFLYCCDGQKWASHRQGLRCLETDDHDDDDFWRPVDVLVRKDVKKHSFRVLRNVGICMPKDSAYFWGFLKYIEWLGKCLDVVGMCCSTGEGKILYCVRMRCNTLLGD